MTAHTIALAGPAVTRSVTWEQVRAYLTAEGWVGPIRWMHPSTTWGVVIIDETNSEMSRVISCLARLASVSPGEMLARIADGPSTGPTPEAIRIDRDHLAAEQRAIHEALGVGPNERPEDAARCLRRAAEDMRERCAAVIEATGPEDPPRYVLAALIRALPLTPTAAPPPNLWALVRARINGGLVSLTMTPDPRPDDAWHIERHIVWRRIYPDGAPSDYRETTGDSEEACLRAVLAHEDAADAKKGRT